MTITSALLPTGGGETHSHMTLMSTEFTVGIEFTVYNRKRVSGAHHTKWVCHIGYSSEAASGNVKFS